MTHDDDTGRDTKEPGDLAFHREVELELARARVKWVGSIEQRKMHLYMAIAASTAVVANVLVALSIGLNRYMSLDVLYWPKTPNARLGTLVGGVIFGASLFSMGNLVRTYRERFYDRLMLESEASLRQKEAGALGEESLNLSKLWDITGERLDLYHRIATQQARRSFFNAQVAIAAGFAVILGGTMAAFFAKTSTATISIAALSAMGGVLSTYIGRTFLKLQEDASAHLRAYFLQPQEHFRYLAAERLLSKMSAEDQVQSINLLIQGIVLSGRTIEESKSNE